jgi:hypothetical protein
MPCCCLPALLRSNVHFQNCSHDMHIACLYDRRGCCRCADYLVCWLSWLACAGRVSLCIIWFCPATYTMRCWWHMLDQEVRLPEQLCRCTLLSWTRGSLCGRRVLSPTNRSVTRSHHPFLLQTDDTCGMAPNTLFLHTLHGTAESPDSSIFPSTHWTPQYPADDSTVCG